MLGLFLLFVFTILVFICEYHSTEADYNVFRGVGIGASFEKFKSEKGFNCLEVQVVILCFHVIYIFEKCDI